MAGEVHSGLAEEPAADPHMGNSTSARARRLAPRPSRWQAIAISVIAAVAVGALIIALTRSTSSQHPANSATATHTTAESLAAQQRLCETYNVAARSVQVDTNGSDKAFARIALTNSAVLLFTASNDPALDEQHRNAAQALATAYLMDTAKSSEGAATEAEFQVAVAEVNTKDAAMKRACGGS
ncbi:MULTISPECIES: hypothetical protein [Mycobacterium]|nr:MULTISPECIES: hypothetical protein [Mycobacterium]MDM4139591.1 hypothetical protein [Mycobacterium sp. FLAC0960]